MCVWMNPGMRKLPPASMVTSCAADGSGPTEAMRPSRIDTAPLMTSIPSFMVRMVALRISVADRGLLPYGAFPAHADGSDGRLGDLPVLDGDQLGDDADGDLLWRDRPDVEPDGRVDRPQ